MKKNRRKINIVTLKIGNMSFGGESLKKLLRYLLKNARVASDTHVRKGTREPVIRPISLKECILCVKIDSVIDVQNSPSWDRAA
jgi:hypothetical protein